MARVTIEVDDTCEHQHCIEAAEYAYVLCGQAGQDGVGVYCADHAQSFADVRGSHTAIAEVEKE